MLGLDFLKQSSNLTFAGMEFMDYQSKDFYALLVKFFDEKLHRDEDGEVVYPADRETLDSFHDLVMTYTGINVSLKPSVIGAPELGITAGNFNPGNLLNVKGIEKILDKEHSSVAEIFRIIKSDILSGTVDTAKGRVGGDFSKVEFTIYMVRAVEEITKAKFLERFKCTLAQALAAYMLHELGHVFGGFLYITRATIDPLLIQAAVKQIDEKCIRGKERVVMIRETLKLMECGTVFKDSDVENMDRDGMLVFFNKEVNTRDARRTLSLGTADRTSEVIADLYAVRFGASKQLVAGLVATEISLNPTFIGIGLRGVAVMIATRIVPLFGIILLLGTTWNLLSNLGAKLSGNEVYDSPYRRVKAILRDQVVSLNSNKSLDGRQKAEMLKEAKELEVIVNEAKPTLEGTSIQRLAGWITNGNDFKPQEFEHYTEELLGHTLSLYKDYFKD